tara:strand:+ start:15756 stop:16265 length:510 start_codon:yes stop_codon:yes gene_type:complete
MIDSITILQDGKLSAFTGAIETYLQPKIEVDTKDNLNQLLIKDKYNNSVLCNTTITSINGVSFSGSFADLETQIRELAKQANELNSGQGGANDPTQQQLTNPAAVVVSGWEKISFVCSGTIDVTINANVIQYPYDLDGSKILGANFESDSSAGSCTFDGTGTVLITIKK